LLVDRDEGVIPVVPRLREDADYFDDLAPGDRLSVRLWREADTEYCFDTQLVARDRGTGTFLLRHSAKVERVQQRDFFRVEASFDIALFGMNDADSGGEGAIEGSGAERDSAAIVLLDTPEGEVASSPDQERDSSPLRGDPPPPSDQTAGVQDRKEHSVDIPDNAPRVDGRVSNISAGGLGMTVTGALPAADRWLVDPAFDGPFPLAGVICRVIGDRRQDDLTVLKLKFEELPTSVESEIVRQVFQYQLLQSGGIRPTGPTEQ
jgi:c-di-GMP-binding flagellar brake protein YcgR